MPFVQSWRQEHVYELNEFHVFVQCSYGFLWALSCGTFWLFVFRLGMRECRNIYILQEKHFSPKKKKTSLQCSINEDKDKNVSFI